MNPRNILLIKSHSMGIGDVLRSSAAWQALKLRWPSVNLHLLFLSRHPGYPTEQLIREHYLLASANFISVTTDAPESGKSRRIARSAVYQAIAHALQSVPIDLVIDFEPNGMRTTLLARWIARQKKAASVGIAQFPLRGLFYTHAAPSMQSYARQHGLTLPMDYTERDFVALAALGIERNGCSISLSVSETGLAWQEEHLAVTEGGLTVTLNIGCGTSGALPKRPPMNILVDNMVALYQSMPYNLHLSGADFERQVNTDFQKEFALALVKHGLSCEASDWSGQCTLSQLTGLLGASDLVISSDSGPYHMAVGLGIPTICWFNFDTPASYHHQAGVQNVITPTQDGFIAAAKAVLRIT